LAGVSRLKYTPSVKIIKVKCTGRIDVKHILYTIKSGADGVMVVG
jgi:F420-non-reducing hydrogenase iron-sulfur subunit